MGFTTVRGVKAEKWKNKWSYEINSTSYSGVKYIINMTVYHYFAKSGWDFVFSDFDNVPLRYERIGTWTAMNYSSKTKDYSIFWTNGSFDHIYDVVAFVNNGVKDSDFVIPTNWRSDCTIEDEYCDNTFNAQNGLDDSKTNTSTNTNTNSNSTSNSNSNFNSNSITTSNTNSNTNSNPPG